MYHEHKMRHMHQDATITDQLQNSFMPEKRKGSDIMWLQNRIRCYALFAAIRFLHSNYTAKVIMLTSPFYTVDLHYHYMMY